MNNLDSLSTALSNIRSLTLRKLKDDDAAQEVTIQTWKAITSGRLKSEDELSRYVASAISRQRKALMRSHYDRLDQFDESDETKMTFNATGYALLFHPALSDSDSQIISSLQMGYSAIETARNAGLSRATLYRRLEQMKEKIANAK
jgi:hypothetical protein